MLPDSNYRPNIMSDNNRPGTWQACENTEHGQAGRGKEREKERRRVDSGEGLMLLDGWEARPGK